MAPLANWASDRKNTLIRPLLEKAAGIDRNAALPTYYGRTFVMRSKRSAPPIDRAAPAAGRKAVLYAICFVNYNNPSIGEATRAVLARNGVETEVLYPRCCGMPQLEQAGLAAVATSAVRVAAALGPWIDKGYDSENTTSDGKASSVQFIRFPFTGDQIARFKTPGTQIIAGFDHAKYGYQAVLPEPVRAALAKDFD